MAYTEEQYLKNTLDSYQAGRQIGRDEERKRILELLARNQQDNTCNCGTQCTQWDAGFQEAINLIKKDPNA
jgi:hypothetical protein